MQLAPIIYSICTTILIVLLVIRIIKLERKNDGIMVVNPYSDEAPIKIDIKIDYIELMQRKRVIFAVDSVKINKTFIVTQSEPDDQKLQSP